MESHKTRLGRAEWLVYTFLVLDSSEEGERCRTFSIQCTMITHGFIVLVKRILEVEAVAFLNRWRNILY